MIWEPDRATEIFCEYEVEGELRLGGKVIVRPKIQKINAATQTGIEYAPVVGAALSAVGGVAPSYVFPEPGPQEAGPSGVVPMVVVQVMEPQEAGPSGASEDASSGEATASFEMSEEDFYCALSVAKPSDMTAEGKEKIV